MAYDSNYSNENRFQAPRINLKVKEGDYLSLINHLARVLGKPFKAQMADDIIEELKQLEPIGWPAIKEVVECLMLLGKTALTNNLWTLLIGMIEQKQTVKKEEKEATWFIPEWERSYELITIQEKITDEIMLWVKYYRMGKPLKYNGKLVIYNEEGFSTATAEKHLSKEDYNKFIYGKLSYETAYAKTKDIGTWCILLDVYLNAIQKALSKEYDQNKPDNNAMKDIAMRFLNHLISERRKQTGTKNDEKSNDSPTA
jgi:hypothetical protein